ncbi:serine/threonine-protein kinase [Blastopirellula marina]|uniref:Protein kinase domain-containing protein n=1 Tax=Blastopirellula marina TaxID=124 RepID=A0A2S8FWF4_9BACT|nr:serine/threonine-protein kinase [Blastopirellula marina]PQO36499.1 hypothetical protein C5Y98_12430 [Blastopirellula marina]PQO47450.1 hypothetical protein C5Y93_05245 [Blastopirellula marina]PTL44337.1 serine/threonine protein kinase [Blastopirellula marina]
MHAGHNDDSQSPSRLIDRLCQDQSRRWRDGEEPQVEEYLKQYPELADSEEDLFDLVYNELQLRRNLLDVPTELSEFAVRFPQFSQRLQRQLLLHEAIQSLKDSSRATRDTLTYTAPSPTMLGLAPGQQLGRYQVRRLIGAGGFGVVYLATDLQLNRDVALKIPRVDDLSDEQQRRFLQEAELAASLEHPYLVTVYDAGQIDDVSYIASAYCPGQNLAQYLQDIGGACDISTAVETAILIAEAIGYAHQRGIVHRDLKPSNVMLTDKPCGSLPFTPQTTDFGLAKLGEQRLRDTSSSMIMGTPLYMAPEQYQSRGTTGPPTDIYAIGVMLYEMLTGKPPHDGRNYLEVGNAALRGEVENPRRLNRQISADLAAIILHCLERAPQHRYQSCGDLARDLRLALESRRVSIRQPSTWERFVLWANERQRIYDAGAVACWLAVCMGIWIAAAHAGVATLLPETVNQPETNLPLEWLAAAGMIVTTVLPLWGAGLFILRDRAWAIYVGVVWAAIPVVITFASAIGRPLLHRTVYEDNVLAGFLINSMIFVVHLMLLLMLLNAARVSRRERRLNREFAP